MTLAVLTSACHTTPYAAVVNGTTISQSSLNNELTAIRSNKVFLQGLESQGKVTGAGDGTFDSRFVGQVLAGRISLVLSSEELARRHVSLTAEDLKLARADVVASFATQSGPSGDTVFNAFPPSYRQELVRDSANLTALEAAVAGLDVRLPALRRYYQSHRAAFTLSCVSHIEVATQAQALALRAQILAGASFASLARTSSIDQSTAAAGGALGCHPEGSFVPAFQSVVDSLAIAQVSQPVQIGPYWNLALVTRRQAEPFSSVAPQVRHALLGSKVGQASSFLASLENRAHISVSPRYGHFAASGSQAGVSPPPAPPASVLRSVAAGR